MRIVSNCPLCEEKSLHVFEEQSPDGEVVDTQQCINCGYATTSKFKLESENSKPETNSEYQKLPEDMQKWAKIANYRVWIPSVLTLPFGMIFPEDVDGEMKWGFAEMVDIPEEEQKDYPDGQGGFFKKMYETESKKTYDTFLEIMSQANDRAKQDGSSGKPKVNPVED